jgi:two-component system sensor histidine kinase HydH
LQAFLDYARPPKLEKTQVDLVQLAQKVEQLLSAQAELRTIQIALQMSADPVVVSGDAEQLRQVLLNLMLNAFDAVGTHGKVTVEVSRSPTAGILRVCDTGQGVPESIRSTALRTVRQFQGSGHWLGINHLQEHR